MPRVDVLIVSLGGTAGLREADFELAASLRRAGASVEVARVTRARELRTFAAIEFAWAVNARRATMSAVAEFSPRAVIYSTTTAALLAPVPGAIRFDAPAAGNRPGRHGVWQRPVEARRFRDASLLVPWSEGGLAEAPSPHAEAVVVPMPVAASGAGGERDIAAITYGANPEKKGLDRVLAAWLAAARPGEELVVAGLDEQRGAAWLAAAVAAARRARTARRTRRGGARHGRGDRLRARRRRARGALRRDALARRVPRAAPALARLRDGAAARGLRDRAARGARRRLRARHHALARPVRGAAGRPRARSAARCATELAIRTALDDPVPGYAERAAAALEPWTPESVDRVVAEQLLPRLIA